MSNPVKVQDWIVSRVKLDSWRINPKTSRQRTLYLLERVFMPYYFNLEQKVSLLLTLLFMIYILFTMSFWEPLLLRSATWQSLNSKSFSYTASSLILQQKGFLSSACIKGHQPRHSLIWGWGASWAICEWKLFRCFTWSRTEREEDDQRRVHALQTSLGPEAPNLCTAGLGENPDSFTKLSERFLCRTPRVLA